MSKARSQTQHVLLNFTAGGAPVQQIDVQINIAFPVKRAVFHPPKHNIAIAGALTDQYLLSSSLNKGMGIVGFLDTMITGVQSEALTVVFDEPVQINGYHKFLVRCFTEAGGGAQTALAAKVWQCVEFYSE